MFEDEKIIRDIENVFAEAHLVGKTLQDIFFDGDDPYINRQIMMNIYNFCIADYPIYARKIRSRDIPDDFSLIRGRSCSDVPFTLVFSDGTAVAFSYREQKAEVRFVPKGELRLPERENNINEHLLYAPVFGQTVREYKVWSITSHVNIRIEIIFEGDMSLFLSDDLLMIYDKPLSPMDITFSELLKTIPHYEDLFDDELELYELETPVAQIWQGKRKDDDSAEARLIRILFEYTDDPRDVEGIMEMLETDEERQKLLEMEEYEKGTIYFGDFLYAAQHIVRIREGKSSEGPFLTGFPD